MYACSIQAVGFPGHVQYVCRCMYAEMQRYRIGSVCMYMYVSIYMYVCMYLGMEVGKIRAECCKVHVYVCMHAVECLHVACMHHVCMCMRMDAWPELCRS
jgi:hypothetical protein